MTRKEKENLIKIAVTAICIGFVAISKFFSFTLPLFGASGMNVGFGGIFTAFPAFLFGPVFGGVASAASDLLGVIIKPTGPYNPIFTITAFCGGFIKGWIWRLLAGRNDGRIRRVALCLLLLLGVVGGAFHIALVSDGVTSGLVSEQAELPTRGAIRTEDYNPLTKLVVHLADYNNDVITYSRYTGEADTVTLPSAIVYPDGYTLKVTKLGEKAFPEAVLRVQIPEGVKTIDEKAFDGLAEGSVIVGAAGSAAQKAAEKAGIAFEEAEVDAQTVEVDAAGRIGRRRLQKQRHLPQISGGLHQLHHPRAGGHRPARAALHRRGGAHQPAPQKARQGGRRAAHPHLRLDFRLRPDRDDDQHRRSALLHAAGLGGPRLLDSLDAARARGADRMHHSGVFHRHPVRRIYDALSGSALTRVRQTTAAKPCRTKETAIVKRSARQFRNTERCHRLSGRYCAFAGCTVCARIRSPTGSGRMTAISILSG